MKSVQVERVQVPYFRLINIDWKDYKFRGLVVDYVVCRFKPCSYITSASMVASDLFTLTICIFKNGMAKIKEKRKRRCYVLMYLYRF